MKPSLLARALLALIHGAGSEFLRGDLEEWLQEEQERRSKGQPPRRFEWEVLRSVVHWWAPRSYRARRGGWRPPWISGLLQDTKYGIRALLRAPGFSVVAIVTLALGIGGNTAIFSVLNSVALRPLDFPEPSRMVRLGLGGPVTARQIDELTERVSSYGSLAGGSRTSFTLTGDGLPEELQGAVVGHGHDEVFQVIPALGRPFGPSDAEPGQAVAIISHALWQRRFGSDPTVVGRTLAIGGEQSGVRTVVGVWPEGYEPFTWNADVFVPILRETDSPLYFDMARFQLAGRLASDVSVRRAAEELRVVVARMAQGEEGAVFATSVALQVGLISYQEAEAEGAQSTLWLLLGAVGLVLLIACTNVTNLLLARSATRSHELAIRTAIGAGRGRVVRQLLTESLLLSFLGGAVGWVGATLLLPLLVMSLPQTIPRLDSVSVDGTVLVFTALVSLVAGIGFGLAPALGAASSVGAALRAGARGVSPGPRRFRLNQVLIAGQTALCVVLVVSAGLLVKSLWLVGQVDPGFNADHLHTLRVRPIAEAYPDAASRQVYFETVLERLGAVPGVEAAGAIQVLPMSRGNMGVGVSPDGAPVPDSERPTFVGYRIITPGYGEATEIPLIEGRWLEQTDNAAGQPVGLINARMAQEFFGENRAVGQVVHWNTGDPWFTVVGVIGDVHQNRLDEDVRMEAYVPLAQSGEADGLHVLVRTDLGEGIVPSLRAAVWSVDRNVPITLEASMSEVVAASLADRRGQTTLFTVFGTLALLLGMIGVYGVTAYTVSQRAHEMGVRVALGADRGSLILRTLRTSLVPVALGLVVGLIAVLISTRLLSAALYQVTPTDPGVLLGVATVLGVVALTAALGPARRAAGADPMVVLARG